MKLSDKKQGDLYNAIADPIIDLRVESQRGLSIENMDSRLFNMQQEIWRRVHKALNLYSIK